MKIQTALCLSFAGALSGCFGLGPEMIDRDNLEYGESWGVAGQRQMLLNIVKLRYAEPPMFLEVASVINQYSLEGQVGVNTPAWDRPTTLGPPVGTASGRWTDTPTITYTPVTGERFTRSLLTPIPPSALASMLQSGWPAEFVFGVTVRSINGIPNGTRGALMREEPDPRYGQLLEDLTAVQRSGQIGLRVERSTEGETVLLVIEKGETQEVEDSRMRIRAILDLDPDTREYKLVYGLLPAERTELAMLSRSVLEILAEFSYGVEVPQEHLSEGRAPASPRFDGPWIPPTVRIRSGVERPQDALVQVYYRDLWFWIDDRDFASKRLFSFAMILISLADSESRLQAPLVTVGAG